LDNSRAFASLVKSLLWHQVALSVVERQAGLVPPLYESGVVFRPEPPNVETFRDALDTYRKGDGDCAHLSVWRCADLIVEGEPATLAVSWRTGQRLFHVRVRRAKRPGQRKGTLEDPSTALDARKLKARIL
jgi:hypothetical protein